MGVISGIVGALSALGKIAGLVQKVWRKLELAGAYVSGWMRSQRVHQEAAEDDLQDIRDDREEAEDESRDDLIDALAGDNPDGVRDAEQLPGDAEAGDRSEHEV